MKNATHSSAYSSFIKQRDKALERIYFNAQSKINDELRAAFTRAMEIVSFRYFQISQGSMMTSGAKHALVNIHSAIDHEFMNAAKKISSIHEQMLKSSKLLSIAGEAQAIAQATDKPAKAKANSHIIKADKNFNDEDIFDRTYLALSRISRDIMDALEMSRINGEDTREALKRCMKVFPKSKKVLIPKKIFKAMEAKKKPIEFVNLSLDVSDEDWANMVSDYMDEYIPKHRGPNSVFDIKPAGEKGDELEEWYAWEMEQSQVNDFVDSVRDGSNKAAKENGVHDFIWVAVIDDRTDECCRWRDGKTLTEIREEMSDHDDEGCDGDVPPLHFNCRCTLAPVLDYLPDMPDTGEKDFEEWLNS